MIRTKDTIEFHKKDIDRIITKPDVIIVYLKGAERPWICDKSEPPQETADGMVKYKLASKF